MRSFDGNKAEFTHIRGETRVIHKGELNGSEMIVREHCSFGHVRLLKLAGESPFQDYSGLNANARQTRH